MHGSAPARVSSAKVLQWVRRFRGSQAPFFLGALLLFFVVFLGVSLEGPDGREFARYTLKATAADIIKTFGYGDAASYAKGATSVFQHGWFTPEHHWIITLWPPGLPLIEGMFMRLLGEDAPLALCLAVLSGAIWALAFACFSLFLRAYVSPATALLAPFVMLGSGVFREFFLRNAIIYSESLSTNAWVLSVALLCLAAQRRSMRLAVLSGLAFALSAYVRGMFSFMAGILAAHGALMALVLLVRHRPRRLAEAWGLLRGSPVAYVLVSALAFQVFTVPYRIYNFQRLGSFGWIHIAHSWGQQWMTAERLVGAGAGWLAEGGSGMACKVDPVQCAELERMEEASGSPYSGNGALTYDEFEARAKVALLTRLPQWVANKAALFPRYWFSHHSVLAQASPSRVEYIQNTLSLLAGLFILALAVRDLFQARADVLTMSAAVLGATHLAVFVVFHFETRYMFPLKVGSLLLALVWSVRALAERARAVAGESAAPAPSPSPAVPPELVPGVVGGAAASVLPERQTSTG